MPGKNLEKIYLEDSYYHIYNRGVNKETIFKEKDDYAVFLNLFKRYLSREPLKDKQGREYPCLHNDIELLAFCLMPNHFHVLVYQYTPDSMTKLLKSVTTTYSMYFNKKYRRVGPVFQSRFKASMITEDAYLQHISRYIHLNPKDYRNWEFSSLPYYLNQKSSSWLKPDKILELFDDTNDYADFVANYKDYKQTLDEIRAELASA
ncbi:hypothetical protein COU91_02845 [Candidatus Saccharibacteria bacterium CG10_big_fil_rev_8_21_14_0_10_47_8]|nr:MAG: hypothetical protein COU91_02845 [Candidatus Saccharibacteria bacterium CG10_big_fil_rev_8_21_14_0_10_47_8]